MTHTLSTGSLGQVAGKAPKMSLRRALRRLRGALWPGIEPVGEPDQAEASGAGPQRPGRHDQERADEEVASGTVDYPESLSRDHLRLGNAGAILSTPCRLATLKAEK